MENIEKIKLESPIKIDGVLVHELSLRKPKVRDLLITGSKNYSEAEREVRLISGLAEIPNEAVEELDLRDYMKIQNWLKDFLSVEARKN